MPISGVFGIFRVAGHVAQVLSPASDFGVLKFQDSYEVQLISYLGKYSMVDFMRD